MSITWIFLNVLKANSTHLSYMGSNGSCTCFRIHEFYFRMRRWWYLIIAHSVRSISKSPFLTVFNDFISFINKIKFTVLPQSNQSKHLDILNLFTSFITFNSELCSNSCVWKKMKWEKKRAGANFKYRRRNHITIGNYGAKFQE